MYYSYHSHLPNHNHGAHDVSEDVHGKHSEHHNRDLPRGGEGQRDSSPQTCHPLDLFAEALSAATGHSARILGHAGAQRSYGVLALVKESDLAAEVGGEEV